MQLTHAGSDLVPHAEQMERAAQAVLRRVSGDDARVEGTVRLTASEGIAGFVLRHLRPLRERHPALTIELLAGNRSFDLLRGEADVALRMMKTAQTELLQKRVGVLGWSLYAAEGYVETQGVPASIADLSGHGVIGFDDSLKAVPGALWLGEGRGARIELRASSTISALNACLAGIGIGCIPCFLGDPEATLRRLTADVVGTREMWIVVHPDLARVARVRTVIDHLTDVIETQGALLSGVPAAR